MAKHTRGDLEQMQALPLQAKIAMTKRRIQEWIDHWEGEVYVSWSGGKDSTVLKHIIDSMGEDVPAVFVNTGLEYPEIQRFVRETKAGKYPCFNSNVEIIRPKMAFMDVLEHYGYPVISKDVSKCIKEARSARSKGRDCRSWQKLRGEVENEEGQKSRFNCDKWEPMLDAPFLISDQCCAVMKKRPAHEYAKTTGRKAIVATMAEESAIRYSQWLQHGCNGFDNKYPVSKPMSFWTEQDVLHYLKLYNVPYAEIYGEIVAKNTSQQRGQINVLDLLGEYTEQDDLETTGAKRTGCIFCMYGCHLEKEPNRFQMLKETHPRQYEYCIGGVKW